MAELRDSDVIQRLIERDEGAYFVAEANDDLLGNSSGWPSDEATVAILGALYINPDHWNKGIGMALLTKFEGFCRQLDDNCIQFHVLSEDDICMSFYRENRYNVVKKQETDRFDESVTESACRGSVGCPNESGTGPFIPRDNRASRRVFAHVVDDGSHE